MVAAGDVRSLAEFLQAGLGLVMKRAGTGALGEISVVDLGGLGLADFLIIRSDVVGFLKVSAAEIRDELAGLGIPRVAGVLDEVVVKCFPSEVEIRLVLVPTICLCGEDEADAEQRFWGFRAGGLLSDQLLVGSGGFTVFLLPFIQPAGGEEGLRGGGGAWCVIPDLAQHLDSLAQWEIRFEAEQALFYAAFSCALGHGDLAIEGGGVEAAALEAGEKLVVGIEGFDDFATVFEQLCLAVTGLRRGRGEGVASRSLVIQFDRFGDLTCLVCLLAELVELLALTRGDLGISRQDRHVWIRSAGGEGKRGC